MASDSHRILQERANFSRLSRLLVDKGTEALRSAFDNVHSPTNLSAVLAANRKSLSRLKPRVINDSQWDLLFPPSGNPPDSKTFDVTLLTVLFRNICGLPSTGWIVMPLDTDRSLQANVTRIKLLRNEVYAHVTSTQVDSTTFQSLWQKIGQALVELNVPQKDVDDLKVCPLGPEEDVYVKMLENWEIQENECMKVLEKLNKEVNTIKERQLQEDKRMKVLECLNNEMKSMKETVKENWDGINQLRQNDNSKESDEDILRKLAKHNFKGKIRSKVKLFMHGTRQWLYRHVDNFVQTVSESRMLLLTAGPGFGKSVFAAKICEDYEEKGTLAASHFCDFDNSNLRDPMAMLQSLASQMCDNIDGFKEKLLDQLKRPHQVHNLKDAFKVYLQNPLDELELNESSLIVIDGLDESSVASKNEIVDLISNYFQDLPEYIKILVTSRPEITLAKLSGAQAIDIQNDNFDNNSDIQLYLKTCVPILARKRANFFSTGDIQVPRRNKCRDVYDMLCMKCEGSFLYAFYMQSELNKRDDLHTMTFQQIFQFLPQGMDSIYEAYFKRLEDELKHIKHGNVDVLRILEILAVSQGPLPLTFVMCAIGLAPDCRETKKIIGKINNTISCLLYVSNDMVTVFHKSVIDWLLVRGYKDHEYAVDIRNGNESLWLLCEQGFEEIRRTVFDFNGSESLRGDLKYALDHGFQHLMACKVEEKFFWSVDVVMIYVLLTVGKGRNKEYILNVWKEILQVATVLSNELRARISWHIVEMEILIQKALGTLFSSNLHNLSFYYLQSVFTHSPEGCFSDEEKKIAMLLSSKSRKFVQLTDMRDLEVSPLAIWAHPELKLIAAVGISHEKTMAAVAFKNGRISVLSVPSLIELWTYPTKYKRIACCVFVPNDSLVLFGKLGTALCTVKRKELPFLRGIYETFVSGAFSPNGNWLVTCNNSYTVKLWDVSRQCLLSSLNAEVHVNWCTFSSTGLYIIGDRKCNVEGLARADSESDEVDSRIADFAYDYDGNRCDWDYTYDELDSFCVWNAITWQRCDERNRADEFGQFQNRKCKHCFKFELSGERLVVDELSLMSPRNIITFVGKVDHNIYECGEVAAMVDDLLFCVDLSKFAVFKKLAAAQENRASRLSRPALVLWNSFSPDGSRFATCVSGGCIEIWDVYTNQIKQRFQSNHNVSLFACWWSEKFLFVFEFCDDVPNLSKYPVNRLEISFFENQQISLNHLVKDFKPLSAILDFSEGLLSFECGYTEPVKVLDVNGGERPQMISLTKIRPMMNITVSPGASFIFGGDTEFLMWKRIASKETGVYDLMEKEYSCEVFHQDFHDFSLYKYRRPKYRCYFRNDSKMAVVVDSEDYNLRCCIMDLMTGNCMMKSFYDSWRKSYVPRSQLFCIKSKILVVASLWALRFYDMDSGALLASSFLRFLTPEVLTQTKVSPKEDMIAFPKRNGDMMFVRLSIPPEPLLSNVKRDAAIRLEATLKGFKKD